MRPPQECLEEPTLKNPGRGFGEEGIRVHTFGQTIMRTRLLLVLALLAAAPAAQAQIPQQYDPEYLEQMYGPVRDVSLDDLAFSAEQYDGKAVRVKGRLGLPDTRSTSWELGEAGAKATIVPIRRGMNEDQLKELGGQMVEVTGLFTRATGQGGAIANTMGVIQFWSWAGPPEKLSKDAKVAVMSLEQLVARAGKMDGQL